MVSAESAQGRRRFVYNANGKLTAESMTVDGRTLSLAYAYDANDALQAVTYPVSGRTVDYAPDPLGRPTQVSGYVRSVSYWPSAGQEIAFANGTVTRYEQNVVLRPSSFRTVNAAGKAYLDSSYGYDQAGNLTSIRDAVDAAFHRTLAYDGLGRLTSASGPWGVGVLSYDGVGNLKRQVFGSQARDYSYDSRNRLAGVSGERGGSPGVRRAGQRRRHRGADIRLRRRIQFALRELRQSGCEGRVRL